MQFFVLRVASNKEDRVREALGEPPAEPLPIASLVKKASWQGLVKKPPGPRQLRPPPHAGW